MRPERFAIPDFAKGAIFTAVLAGLALGFASSKQPRYAKGALTANQARSSQSGQNRITDNSAPKQTPLTVLADWLLDVKLSDLLLAGFTGVLAWKTSGLNTATQKLWEAGERQIALATENAERQSLENHQLFASSERAWLEVSAVLSGPITWDVNGCNFSFCFTMYNHGKTPALKAFVHYSVADWFVDKPLDAQNKVAIEMPSQISGSIGYTIWPQNNIQMERSCLLGQAYLEKSIINKLEEHGASDDFILPYLVGVVRYETVFGEKRETSFIYEIACVYPDNGSTLISPAAGTIKLDRLQLRRWFESGSVT